MSWAAVRAFFGGVPQWLWYVAAAFGVYVWARRDAYSDGQEDRQREIIDDIREQADERSEAIRKAENRVTRDLNERSLRDITAGDPNNRLGVRGN